MIGFKQTLPERDQILSSGEQIRIRQLSPAERLRFLFLPGDVAFCRRLSAGLVFPKISFRKAKAVLQENPFRALEIVRAIQNFTAEFDYKKKEKMENRQNEMFLAQIQAIESLRDRQRKN